MVPREKMVKGIAAYIRDYVIPQVMDSGLKVVLSMLLYSLNEDTVYKATESILLSGMLREDEDRYDLNYFTDCMKAIIKAYGSILIRIPEVPLIMPDEKTLLLCDSDIEDFRRCVEQA